MAYVVMENKLEIKDKFYLNGNELQIISGGIHYFRVVPQYWRDRLEKLKNMGCNTVETYVPWNMHEPKKGEYCFSQMLDLKAFIELAGELSLYVIIRPSPYICAEWEFGGLPAWLLKEDGMRLRGSYPPFLEHVKNYYHKLFSILTPLQINYGGPIIMMQIENEYGYYGDDSNYLESIKNMMLEEGAIVPFVTSDGPWGDALACGSIEGVLPTGNFGSATEKQFSILRNYTNGPLMCMEFWVGWFDSWGEKHQTSDLEKNKEDFEEMLKLGNVNIYMFEGGTNFGFMNGSNYYDKLTPDTTSYDYDAVLTESGKITKKYKAFQEIVKKYRPFSEIPLSTNIEEKAYGVLKIEQKVGLFEALGDISTPFWSTYPTCMEKLGQNYGYVLYESKLVKEKKLEKLRLLGTNDRAIVFINGKCIATLYDRELLEEVTFDVEFEENSKISILVENMGRVNFGPNIEKQRKGIDGTVVINGHQHFSWDQYTLPLDNLSNLDFSKGYTEGRPAFYKFSFIAEDSYDTYLDFSGFGKGCAFINGFHLGRFWEIGPQRRLYIPGPLIQKGKNEIILFETEGKAVEVIHLEAEAKLE